MCANEGGEESLDSNVDSQPLRPPTVRRRKNPAEVLAAGETVKDALSTLKETMNNRRIQEDDECDLHGKIIAKKLRKLPDNERMRFVCDIYNMFLHHEQVTTVLSSSSVHSFRHWITVSGTYCSVLGTIYIIPESRNFT